MSSSRTPRPGAEAIARQIQIKVRPGARHSALVPAAEGEVWTAQLKSPPVDGRANEELIELLAEHFGVAKRAVTISSGAGARLKRVQIEIPTEPRKR